MQQYGVMIGPLRSAANNPATKPEVPLDHTHETPAILRLERSGYTAEFIAEAVRRRSRAASVIPPA